MKGYVLRKEQEYIVVEPTGKITKSTKNRTVFPDVQEATSLLLRATAKPKVLSCRLMIQKISLSARRFLTFKISLKEKHIQKMFEN